MPDSTGTGRKGVAEVIKTKPCQLGTLHRPAMGLGNDGQDSPRPGRQTALLDFAEAYC